jgi:DNA-binding NtrC family response regulator
LLKAFNAKFNRAVKGFSSAAIRKLEAYDWPGNIRELENVVQKAVLYCEKPVIEKEVLDIPVPPVPPVISEDPASTIVAVPVGDARALKPEHLRHLLKINNGIVRRAAKQAGISRTTFLRKLKEFGVPRRG